MIAAAETETKGPPRRRRSPPRRVLILEDDYFVAAELARSVERLGCQVVGPVASAAEAVKLLSHDLQLVLCDVNLGDGIDVTVPEAAMRMDVPFALVTGYERAALPSHLQSAPHLCKPHGDLEIADLLDMTAPRGGAPEPENALWRRFSERTKARLRRHACIVHLRRRQTILHKGEPIRRVLFPESGACSILVGAPKPVETNLVGSEGAIGASAVFGATRAAASCKVQVDGRAVAVSVGAFRRILADDPEARDLVGEYILAQLNECGRLAHAVASATVARRVARWLLTCADRVGPEIPVSHDDLSVVLHVRRAGVTIALQELQDAGAVELRRRHIRIADRALLEAAAGPAYGALDQPVGDRAATPAAVFASSEIGAPQDA